MHQHLRVLIVEDSENDADLLLYTLRREGYEVAYEVVDTPSAMRSALERQDWDVITSDHAMPRFSAPASLALAKELRPDLPFIIVSGEIDLNLAVSLMKGGAQDYIQKHELARVAPAIERELRDVEIRRERQQADEALKVSETRYRRLFETARDGILILDANTGQIMDVNPFMVEMLGYSKEEFLGKDLWEIGVFQDMKASKFAFEELQRTGYIRYEDLPLETNSGKRIDVEFVSNVYLINHAQVIQCNIRDITTRKRADTEIHKLNAELEQRVRERTIQLEAINRELEAFNHSVSHDLRAPLRRINGFAETLQKDYADQQSAASLQVIENIRISVQRMNDLIDALLELARFSCSESKWRSVDLSAIVQLIAVELQQNYPTRQVEFVIAEGVMVHGDEQLLRIALENLLSNAWKFTAQCISASIEFGAEPQADGRLTYFVRDNGVGFDMTYIDRLFGPFQRLHSDKEFPGIGIGLATVQRIIRRLGGHIWAKGAVDQGATFYFTMGGA